MATTSPIFGLRIPSADGSDPADLATLLRNLGLDVESKAGGITAMTAAQRTALTGSGKYEGRVVYETDTDLLWRSDGSTWRQLVVLDASGNIVMGSKKITGLAVGTSASDAATKSQVDAASSAASAAQATANAALPKAGGTMSGAIAMGNNKVTGLAAGTVSTDAANKSQVDAASSAASAAQSAANAALPKAGGTMTGAIAMGGNKVTGVGAGTVSTDAANKSQVDAAAATADAALPKAGGTMSGAIAMGSQKITGLAAGTASTDAATKGQVDSASAAASAAQATADAALPKAGGTMSGAIAMGSQKITGLAAGTAPTDAATKGQVDAASSAASAAQATANAALPKAGGTMTGPINMGSDKITGLTPGTASTDAATKGQVDTAASAASAAQATANAAQSTANSANTNANGRVSKAGDTVSGHLTVSGNLNTNGNLYVFNGMYLTDAATPTYSDLSDARWMIFQGDGRVRRVPDFDFRLYVAGIAASSQHLKHHIGAAATVPDVSALAPKTYVWNDDGFREITAPGERFGLIAEEVAAVDDRLVTLDADGEVTGLDHSALIAALIAKVADLEARIEAMEQ